MFASAAPLAGLAAEVRDRISLPVVDQVQAAVKLPEALVAPRPRNATMGTYRRPDAGLSPSLTARLEHMKK